MDVVGGWSALGCVFCGRNWENNYDDSSQCGHVSQSQSPEQESLYERLGGAYGIAGAVDDLVDRLYHNDALNQNPAVREFHEEGGEAGFKYLVTAWSIEATGGPEVYPGRDMDEAHDDLDVSKREFQMVYDLIEASLYQVGVPERECGEFMDIIDSYRDMVVADRDYDAEEAPDYVESPASY
jgi:hemoglobin